MSEHNKPHTNTSNATNFLSLVQPPLGEYEIAQIALALWREGESNIIKEKLEYAECVRIVKEAHGLIGEQVTLYQLQAKNKDLQDRIDYLLTGHSISQPETRQMITKIQSLEASNDLLTHWIKELFSDPASLEEKRAEFKEFLESINQPENK